MADIYTGPQAADIMASWHSYGHRFCLQAVSRAFQGGDATHVSKVDPVVSVATASQHWAAMPASLKHSGDRNYAAIPKGAVVQCTGGDGHIFISMGGGYGVSTDYPSAGVISVAPIASILAHFSGNPYAGWGEWINGRQIVLQQALTGTQRQVRSDIATATRRNGPSTDSALAGDPLTPGTVGNFVAFVHGQAVSQSGVNSDVWFIGTSGNYFWAGSFTDQGTHDLEDRTPKPATDPTVRTVLNVASNKRSAPTTLNADGTPAPTIGSAAANSQIKMVDFAHGQQVNGNDLWYSDGTGWYWSGGFTTQDTTGLADKSDEFTPPTVIVPTAYFIDINGDKLGIDFARVKNAGVEAVIVKAGGHNTSKQTISAEYPQLVDGARAVGLPVGHYYVTGVGDPADEATFLVKNLHDFDVNHDVIALDNELFNKGPNGDQNVNTALWDDDQVTAFFTTVHNLTGIPYTRLWHYTNDVERGKHDWTKSDALGVRPWVAGYGSNPSDPTPQAKPQTKNWWVHQFSSQQVIDGYSGHLDGNWSEHTIEELFATGVVGNPNSDGGTTDPGDGGTTPPTDDGDTAPNWFVNFLNMIINAIKAWLGGTS